MPQLTRVEAEHALARKYLGKIVTFSDIRNVTQVGKVQRITCWVDGSELMVIFFMNRLRYEVDINYFLENTTIQDGNS